MPDTIFNLQEGVTIFKTILTYPFAIISTRKQLLNYPFTDADNGKTYSGTILGIAQQLFDEGYFTVTKGAISCACRRIPTMYLNLFLQHRFKKSFKVEKDASNLKKFLSNIVIGGLAGATTLAVLHGVERWQLSTTLPPKCVTEPTTYYNMYSGFGISAFGIFFSRGLYLFFHNMAKGSVDLTSGWSKFALGTVVGLISYPLDTIRKTQIVNCCTIPKAISIINDNPDGLWEGYMGGWKERVLIGLAIRYVYIGIDHLVEIAFQKE